LELLNQIFTQGEKALIFTQYREMGDILSQMVQNELQYQPLFFHGGVDRNHREEMVQSFQDPDGPSLMIISLKAGGTGLNLTAANHVIHYDLWWNPAVENQATDRSYRIGQTKNVMVHRLITLKTFEEQIEEMLKKKQGLADQIIQTGERWITELSDEELKKLFSFNPRSTVNSE
jgi:SNF2 family DNA or RNA helicase